MMQVVSSRMVIVVGAIAALVIMIPKQAAAQAEPYIGQLMITGANFCPRGWAQADGQLLAISQNTALFSLLGTNYGGNGVNTFALPDMRGRVAIHQGTGPGLSNYVLGQTGGTESFYVTTNNMPPHNHQVRATNAFGDKGGPGDKYLASDSVESGVFQYSLGPSNKTMAADMITSTGGGQPIYQHDPYLTLMWCIALEGIYPSRN